MIHIMKYVLLAIFVLFAATPVQASPCDMCDDQNDTMSGHSMHEDSMSDDHEQPMDCCDHNPTESDGSCDAMSHCGASTAGAVAIIVAPINAFFSPGSQQVLQADKGPLSQFSSPPFRPPIS